MLRSEFATLIPSTRSSSPVTVYESLPTLQALFLEGGCKEFRAGRDGALRDFLFEYTSPTPALVLSLLDWACVGALKGLCGGP